MARRPFAALLLALAIAGCGGPGFEGEVEVPDGYATYRGSGVSFVHPASWRPVTRGLGRGITEVRFQAAGATGAPAAIVLTAQPRVGARFDTEVASERQVLERAGGAGVEQDGVDVPGARKAYLSRIELPDRGMGESRAQAVDLLLPDGSHVALAAGAPERDADALDVDAVIASLRVAR